MGLGAFADRDGADDFLRRTGVRSFPLLWSEAPDSWQPFDVSSQPYAVLLVDGQVVERWPGGVSPEQLTERVAELR